MLLSGCWDSTDINSKNIATAIGIDRQEDEHILTTEIANLTDEKSSEEEKYSIFEGKGNSFADARFNLNYKLANPVYLGTVRMLFLTIPLAENGVEEYLYRLRNLHEYRKNAMVVTTFDKPKDIFSIQQNSDRSVGNISESMIEYLEKAGESFSVTASNMIEWLSSDNQDFLIPNMDINEDDLIITGYSIIHRGVYLGFIPSEVAKGAVILLNKNAKCFFAIPFEDRIATVEANLKGKKIDVDYKDEKLTLDIKLKFDSVVKYLSNNVIYGEKENQIVNSELNKMLKEEVQTAIYQSQKKYKSDYLRFNEYFRIKYPNEYKEIDWYKVFSVAQINISIENELDPGGEFDYKATVE
jgi:Ger(x)C family germination protein